MNRKLSEERRRALEKLDKMLKNTETKTYTMKLARNDARNILAIIIGIFGFFALFSGFQALQSTANPTNSNALSGFIVGIFAFVIAYFIVSRETPAGRKKSPAVSQVQARAVLNNTPLHYLLLV